MCVCVCVLQILEIHGSSLEEQFPNWNSTLGYLCNVQKCLLQGVASLHETICLPTCLATFRCEMMPKQTISVEFPKLWYFGQKRMPRPSAQGEKNKWLVQRVSKSQNLGNSSPTRFRFSSDLGPVCTKRPGTRRQHRLSADLSQMSQSARKIEMGAKKWMKTLTVPSMLPMLPPFWDFFWGVACWIAIQDTDSR